MVDRVRFPTDPPNRAPDDRHAGRQGQRGRSREEEEHLPPPPPPGSGAVFHDRWEGAAEALPPPPPLPLGSSRPDRLFAPGDGDGGARRDSPRERGRKPSSPPAENARVNVPVPVPLPSPPAFRPERVVYSLAADSPSPTRILGSPPRPKDGREKRRRSPPRRSPSPAGPPKRPRRDDGDGPGPGRRSSSPRGGRYGHGGGGGRFTGHAAPDGPDFGCGASSNGQDITQSKGLMTYKQFTQSLEDDVSPAEVGIRYQEYKTTYITTQKSTYFDLHKDETWLKEMYHPTNLLSVIERRNEFCKAAAKNFILDLRSENLDLGPGITSGGASKSGNDNDGSSENGEDYGNKRRKKGRGHPKESGPLSTAPKAHPISSKYRRIQIDIDQAQALVRKLDAEKGIIGNILSSGGDHGKADVDRSNAGSAGPIVIVRGLTTVKGLDGVDLLDTLVTYLWRIHGVDYYGMSELKDAKGFRHVRADNKTASAFDISAADWEKKLDSFWQRRLENDEDPLVVLTANHRIDAATIETLETYVKEVMDENRGCKYGCGAQGCAKVFHAPEFVKKHLQLKHPDLVSRLTSRVQDDIYFQNYMNDPTAPGGVPIMQKSEQESDRMRRIPDKQIVGAIDAQVSNAPFVPEFSPPRLFIPLPGSGPLGPFVPAPPYMDRQMRRDQRPPRPHVDRRRNERSIPGPMMPMYPHFTLYPRPLRSYNDLDALAEEVTPIDYRSV